MAAMQSAGLRRSPDGELPIVPLSEFMERTAGGRPNQMNTTPYSDFPFQCACGRTHYFDPVTTEVIRELAGMRLVIGCPSGEAITCVKGGHAALRRLRVTVRRTCLTRFCNVGEPSFPSNKELLLRGLPARLVSDLVGFMSSARRGSLQHRSDSVPGKFGGPWLVYSWAAPAEFRVRYTALERT
jgi:hypothetical protein